MHRYGHFLSPFLLLLFGNIRVTLSENPLGDIPGEMKAFQSNLKVNVNHILNRVQLSSRNNDFPPCTYLGKTDLCSSRRGVILEIWNYILLGWGFFSLCFVEKKYSSWKIFRGTIDTENELSVVSSKLQTWRQSIFVLQGALTSIMAES